MNGDLSLSQALGGLRIANPDDAAQSARPASTSDTSQQPPTATAPTASATDSEVSTNVPTYESQSAHPPPQHAQLQPGPLGYSSQGSRGEVESIAATPAASSHYPSRHPSQSSRHAYSSSRQAPPFTGNTALPPRRSSRGMAGGYASTTQSQHVPYAGDAPVPTSSADWQERGAAVGVRREVDASGRTVVRQVKKGVRDFNFGSVLGEGSYSSVYLATDRQTLKEYAVKVLEKRHIIKEKKIKYVNIEKNTLNRLTEHPGIVRLYYTFQDESCLYYVLDLCAGGELLGVLKKTGTFDVDCTRFYSAQILDAVEYMHSRGVIHRDLKPENVLLDDQMHVKITDFGTAKLLSDPRDATHQGWSDQGVPDAGRREADDSRAASFVGTAEYVSPELLTNKNACKASDLWAFGCIVYQLLAGRPPFKAGSEYLTFQKIVNLEYEFPQGFPPAARDLVERLLVLDPARRLTIEHIKNHEFFDGQSFGKALWRTRAPRLRPYLPLTSEPTVIQLNGSPGAGQPVTHSRLPSSSQVNPSASGSRPSRIITELPPPTQLDIEWSPVLTRTNERILRLGDLMVIVTPLSHGGSGKGEEGHKKLSRFFGSSTTKKRQRLVMVTSSGRIILAPAGGEDKRAKQELSLTSSDCSWRTQQDAKGQLVWCVDTGGHRYTFEDTKNSTSSDEQRASAEEWTECLEHARNCALSQNMSASYSSENGLGNMSSAMSSPSSTLGGLGGGNQEGFGSSDRPGRNHLSKSQVSLDDPTPASKRNRFSKRQSRNGVDLAF